MISKVSFTYGVLSVVEAAVGSTTSLNLSGAFMVYKSLVWGKEYLGAPDGECEQGSTIYLKGLLDLGGKGGK